MERRSGQKEQNMQRRDAAQLLGKLPDPSQEGRGEWVGGGEGSPVR